MQGTLDYMAPEVLACTDRDRPDLAYGLSADIWALGAMLHELMLGRTPFCHADILVTIKVCPAETLCMISACKATSLDSLVTDDHLCCTAADEMGSAAGHCGERGQHRWDLHVSHSTGLHPAMSA